MIVYFSGTGNSRFAARFLAEKTGDACVDAGALMKTGQPAELRFERPWVFVCPTYAWNIPRVFAQFLVSSALAGSRQAYFVMTCGGQIGNAAATLRKLCAQKKLEFLGVCPVPMPDNYIVMFTLPGKAECSRLVAEAQKTLAGAAAAIGRGEALPAVPVRLSGRLCSSVVNALFSRFSLRTGPFCATDACIGCGKCAEACALNNIRLENERPVWGQHCTQCMACISCCPQTAIEYGEKTLGKSRYPGPEAYLEAPAGGGWK